MTKKISLLLMLCVMLLFPIQAFAVDYSIEKMSIDAALQADGDVQVTEQQTYQFDSEFNGITRTLIPKEGTDIVDVAAHENNQALEVEQDGNVYKIHRKGKNESMTVEVTYVIQEGVSVYSDVAEFYWPFFDSSNESAYEQFDVTVRPPEVTQDVIAFGYDTAQDRAEIGENGTVHFDLGRVSSGEMGDIRVAYDQGLFPAVSFTTDIAMRAEIEAEQQRLINEQLAFEKQQSTLRNIAPYILGALALVFIGLLLFARHKKQMIKADVSRKFPRPYFVPKQIMSLPATLFYMKRDLVQPEVLSAALMDLVRKEYVEETKDGTFEVVNNNTTREHEAFLISWLFHKVGQNGTFKMEDLEAYIEDERNQGTYQMDYVEWQRTVRNEKEDYHLFARNARARLMVGGIALFMIPFIVYLGMHELFLQMSLGILLAIGFFVFAAAFQIRTTLGMRIKRDWDAFQDLYPKMADDEWDQMVTDDQKRAFIYGVGMNDKKIDEKNKKLLNRHPSASYSTSNPMHLLLFASMMSPGFSQAQTTSAATTTGTSAGGGGGVGGGGGGSGAF